MKVGDILKDGTGADVRIICVDRNHSHSVVGLTENEDIKTYSANGRYYASQKSDHDLVLPEDYYTYHVDEPVLVQQTEGGKIHKAYFAKFEDGIVYTFGNGGTSWSQTHQTSWNFCRRPTPEELGK